MIKMRMAFYLLAVTLFLSCSDTRKERRKAVENRIINFQKNKSHWNALRRQLLNDQYIEEHLGLLITPKKLNDSLCSQLIKNGIVYVSVSKDDNCEEITFNTDWTKYPIGALTLVWTSCATNAIPQKGEYIDHFEKNFIEMWGLGDNWTIVVDSDFI